MQTFIISSKNLQQAQAYVQKVCDQTRINTFDRQLLEFEKALGIEDVRSIQRKIFLKPFKGSVKAVTVSLINGITLEAQNAMLKILEEPPANTLIFLITDNYQTLLPTIQSRAKIIVLKTEEAQISRNGLKEILSIKGAGDSLYLAQTVSEDKNEAILWLESAILAARERMLSSLSDPEQSLRLRKLIHMLELAHYDLKTTNVNPRLCLENLFLNL